MNELGDLYMEGWKSDINRSPSHGVEPPGETQRSLAYKGLFGAPESGTLDKAMAMSAISPVEQEEEAGNGRILRLIDSELDQLDHNSNIDRNTILVLSRLKNKIQKLA